MARIDGQLQDEKEMAIDVLLWISSALRPLKVAELEHALAVEIGGPFLDRDNLCPIEELVSVCAGLVTVDQESSIARLVHFTTQQYFERTRDKWFADADLRITSNCLTYLNFDDFGEGPCLEPRLFQDRLQNHPFYDYAATNWGNHAKKCGVEGAKAVDIFKRPDHVDSMSQALMASITWPLDEQFVNQFAKGMNGLHLAAFFGFQEMTEYHLDRGMPPDHADSHDRTPLCWAAMKGCFGIVKLLVGTRKVDPLRKDNNTRTPLSWASQGGFLDIVKLLLESDYNVDPDAVDDYGWTPLCWAAEYGREEVVKLFLSLPNVNPSFEDKNSRTPISWAAKNGHKEVVQLLFEATGGADADLPDVDGWAPLAFAADNGEDDITRFLIDTAGALPDRRDEDGRSALSWAAQYGHESTARLLMNYPDVQVSARELDGRTPLFWAAQYGNYNVVKCLLNAAPEDADIEDNSGWTPFCWAAEHRCMSVMELLLDVGKARPDSRDFNNRGPISWAAQVGHEDVVKMLLNRSDVDASAPNTSGATTDNHHNGVIRLLLESNNTNVDLKGYQGRTPLSTAAAAGNSLAVSLLLQADGVNVNSVDLAGRTPLSLALQQSYFAAVKRDEVVDSVETTSKTASSLEVQQGYREVVKALLDSPDIDVNKRDLAGWSPLHQVIMMCGRGFDWLLNSPKIDLNVRDSRGRTPLSHAASQQHGHDTVELLLGLQGVNVSSRDDTGCTPLYWAVHGRQEDAIELLLSSGRLPANIGELCVDKSGFSAVQLAAMNGDDKVVAMLMERGAVLPEDVFGLQSLLAYDEDAE